MRESKKFRSGREKIFLLFLGSPSSVCVRGGGKFSLSSRFQLSRVKKVEDEFTLTNIEEIGYEPRNERYPVVSLDHNVTYFAQLSTKLFYSKHEKYFFPFQDFSHLKETFPFFARLTPQSVWFELALCAFLHSNRTFERDLPLCFVFIFSCAQLDV
jgi:hypothetical protein